MNIGILGGDLRIIFLSQILIKDGHTVYSYGIENEKRFNETKICTSIKELGIYCDTVISGIPFSKDGININSPFGSNRISIDEVFKLLKNKRIMAGSIKPEIKEKANRYNIQLIDLMDNERLTILNVIPTVEGAIEVAIKNTEYTIHKSNSLVLGFGRIGKALSKTLKDLGANVNVEARKESDLAWINLYGYKGIHIKDLNDNLITNRYDIIFNTIPTLIIDDNKLKIIKEKNENTVIIELASSPGGLDFEKAKKYNLNVIKALGLPGKVAPQTAARYIKDTIKEIIN